MESLLAIGVGLVLRILVDAATDNDERISGVLVGLWEGVVLNHFVRHTPPRSFDPYLGLGFRIFVDFLFTQSLSRLALVALWALVGMLLADVVPTVWRDSGLRRLYRQVRKDVRRVERAVPRIRIKNDLPSVRLFSGRSRVATTRSSEVSSIRSDRAVPSRSPAPSPAPTPGPTRRQGRSPPGTFPNVSGWSETGTDLSILRENIVIPSGPSPSLIPTQEIAAHERTDTATHVSTSQARTTTVQDTTITITEVQKSETVSVSHEAVVETATLGAAVTSTLLEPTMDSSRLDPPTIADDWVDINAAQPGAPVTAFEPHPESTPEHQRAQTRSSPQPAFVIVHPPAVSDTLDIDGDCKGPQHPEEMPLSESRAASVIGVVQSRSVMHDTFTSVGLVSKVLRPPEEISLPESRASSVIGGVQSRSVLHDTSTCVDQGSKTQEPPEEAPLPESRATSVIGGVQSRSVLHDTFTSVDQVSEVSRTREEIPLPELCAASVVGSAIGQPQSRKILRDTLRGIDQGSKVPRPPEEIPLPESRAASDIGGVYDQPQPRSAWHSTQHSRAGKATSEIGANPAKTSRGWVGTSRTGSKLKQSVEVNTPEVPPKESRGEPVKLEEKPPTTTPAQVDSPANILMQPGEGDAPPLLLSTSPKLTQEAMSQGLTAPVDRGDCADPSKISPLEFPPSSTPSVGGEASAEQDSVTQDEAPTELTEEQKAAERKRLAFLSSQEKELQRSGVDLRKKLNDEDDLAGGHAKALKTDVEDMEKMLTAITARQGRKKFSEAPLDPSIEQVALVNMTALDAEALVTSSVLNTLLERDDAGPMTIQFTINRQKPLKGKAKDLKDAVLALTKRHGFAARSEPATPGIINVTF